MDWSDETEQGFPPQRHKEPFALRQDILDELADHLALATERESESGTNTDHEIHKNVLEKFGNPTTVVYALWWDAMKGTIMKDWIQIIVNVVLCLGVMAFMTVFYRQMQTSNGALIEALIDRNNGPVSPINPSVELRFQRATPDGGAVEGVEIELTGAPFEQQDSRIKEYSDAEGKAIIGPIRPGNYRLIIRDPNSGFHRRVELTLYEGKTREPLEVVLPPSSTTQLDTSRPISNTPLVEDLAVACRIHFQWTDPDGNDWSDSKLDTNALMTPTGLFRADRENSNRIVIQREIITEGLGEGFYLSNPYPVYLDEESGVFRVFTEGYNYQQNRSATLKGEFDFNATSTKIQFEVPQPLVDNFLHNIRVVHNGNSDLPNEYEWFPTHVADAFPDHIVHGASLVGQSVWSFANDQHRGTLPGRERSRIQQDQGYIVSLENAPTAIPDGYKLVLAFNSPSLGIREFNPSLNMAIETIPIPFDATSKVYLQDSSNFSTEIVWKIEAEELAERWRHAALIDLTEVFRDRTSFKDATALHLQWSELTNNEIQFRTPENGSDVQQPVWILLRPYPEVATQ